MTTYGGIMGRFWKAIGLHKDDIGGGRRLNEPDEGRVSFSKTTQFSYQQKHLPEIHSPAAFADFGGYAGTSTPQGQQRYTTAELVSKHVLPANEDPRRRLWADVKPTATKFAHEQYARKFTNQPLYLDRSEDIEISDDEETAYVADTRGSNLNFLTRPIVNEEMQKSPISAKPIPGLIPRSTLTGPRMRPIERKSRFSCLQRPSQDISKSIIFPQRSSSDKKLAGISKENRFSRSGKMMMSALKQTFNINQRNDYKKLLDDMLAQSSAPKFRTNLCGPQPKQKIVETINLVDFELSDDEVQITAIKTPAKSTSILQDSHNLSRKKTPIVAPINANKSITLSSSGSTSRVSTPDIEPVNSILMKVNSTPCCQEDWLTKKSQMQSKRREEKQKSIREVEKLTEEYEKERKKCENEFFLKKLQDFAISSPTIVVEDSEEDEEDALPDLTPQQLTLVRNVSHRGSPSEVIVSKFNLNITRHDLSTLVGDAWLNDEVINFYMNLLTERSTKGAELPKVYAMNTFFAVRLLQAGHAGVKRWTRKVDIFAQDIIPVPVHVGNVHWCMAIVHMRNRTIRYYDSMGQPNMRILDALEQYLKSESLDKKQRPFDMTGWEKECMADAPRQMNGSDCGVFSCMFAEYLTRDRKITFTQTEMPYFRQKMILEIATGQLLL